MSSMRGLRIAAWCVATASFVSLGLGLAGIRGVLDWLPLALAPFLAVAWLAPAVVGALIANRQPRNRIAWILLLGSFGLTVQVPLVSQQRPTHRPPKHAVAESPW